MAVILLVEPDAVLARTYRSALESCGHVVRVAVSAQAAVAAADEQRPDIVVLELQLPRHNGIEFLYEFRSYVDWQPIPVVAHTMVPPGDIAIAQPALREALGVGVYLYKPQTTLRELTQKIAEALEAS